MAQAILIQPIQGRGGYAPPVRLVAPPQKNWLQKVIALIGEFLLFCRPSLQARGDMVRLFRGRLKIWTDAQNPQVAKAVQVMQRYLVGQKRGNLEGSYFGQLGISNRRFMDPVFLDLAVHMDPQEYLRVEKGRLERYRVQLLTQAGRDLMGKLSRFPELSRKIQELLIERGNQCTVVQLTNLIQELRSLRPLARSKSVLHLEEIYALMQMVQMEPHALDQELLFHYLGALEIQEKLTLQRLSKNALSRSEVRALEILSQRLAALAAAGAGNLPPLEQSEKRRLDRFLEGAEGNLELNARLMKYASAQHMTVSKAAIDLVLDISFKLNEPAQFVEVINKIQRLEEKIGLNRPTNQDEKLSLGELKKVESLARLHERVELLQQIGAPIEHRLLLSAARANRFVNAVLGSAEREKPHKGNSCIFYDFQNAFAYGRCRGGAVRAFIYRLIPWPLTHVAAGIHVNGENKFSHMWNGVHVLERKSIGDYAFKTFEFDFTKLISEEGQALLRRKLGDNWIQRVEGIHEDITNQIHNNKELLSRFINPPTRWPFIALWFVGFGSRNNRAEEHRELDRRQMCSSFVLNIALETFERLEAQLKEVCNANLEPLEVPLSADYRFLKLPIHKKRLLNCVLPHQLPNIILPTVRETEKPAIIRQILNFHEFAMP